MPEYKRIVRELSIDDWSEKVCQPAEEKILLAGKRWVP
jgi:hypothetical protein